MRTWLLRGGVLAVVHACAQTIMAGYEVNHPTSKGTLAAIVLGGLVGVAAVWGVVDTWRSVRGRELAWLWAALLAGWGAGVLGVIGRSIFVDQTGTSELGSALTGGAAFTALLVIVPAGIGMLAGKWITPPARRAAVEDEEPTGRHARKGA
jgi:hypothetical protein